MVTQGTFSFWLSVAFPPSKARVLLIVFQVRLHVSYSKQPTERAHIKGMESFSIVAEGLTGLMREALHKKQFKGFMVGRNMVEISILQYANDAIFFGEATTENVKAIKVMLRSFELVSGLKINFAKSHFRTIGMSMQWMKNAATYLNCSLLSVPFSYLGIPMGANPRSSVTWDPIVKKCKRKLAKWKQKHLSFGGRVTLIKSALNSILIYFLSFFRITKKVVDNLVKLKRWFLWGGGLEQKKITCISWESACLSKEKEGLGIRNLTKFNCALLRKWRWNRFNHHEAWVQPRAVSGGLSRGYCFLHSFRIVFFNLSN